MKAAFAFSSVTSFWVRRDPTQSNENLSRYWLTPEYAVLRPKTCCV